MECRRRTIRRIDRLQWRRGLEQDHTGQLLHLVDRLLREYCCYANAYSDTNTYSDTDAYSDTNAYSDADAYSDTDTDAYANTNANFAA